MTRIGAAGFAMLREPWLAQSGVPLNALGCGAVLSLDTLYRNDARGLSRSTRRRRRGAAEAGG